MTAPASPEAGRLTEEALEAIEAHWRETHAPINPMPLIREVRRLQALLAGEAALFDALWAALPFAERHRFGGDAKEAREGVRSHRHSADDDATTTLRAALEIVRDGAGSRIGWAAVEDDAEFAAALVAAHVGAKTLLDLADARAAALAPVAPGPGDARD